MAALAAISFNAFALKSSLPNPNVSEQYNGKSVSDNALSCHAQRGSMRDITLHQNILIKRRRADSLRADDKHCSNYSLC